MPEHTGPPVPERLQVPIVLLVFLRQEAALAIVDRLRQVHPTRVYILSDQGRDDAERATVLRLRAALESAIDWDCEVIRNYAEENRGVYENIALGAKWVFEREAEAIFLEDDNIPETGFFRYCAELLDRYRDDPRVLWVCGTNYLGDAHRADGPDYSFTRHLLPCGWASWSEKFLRWYDFDLAVTDSATAIASTRRRYDDKRLWRQQFESVLAERRRRDRGHRYGSWDHHMALTLRSTGMLGAVPARNQIRNVGADELSTHGGTSLEQVMTRRFCGMDSYPLEFPLRHPLAVAPDPVLERALGAIILHPVRLRVRAGVRRVLGRVLRLDPDTPLRQRRLRRPPKATSP